MPRKGEKLNTTWFNDQVVRVFKCTTPEDRFQIALAFCTDYSKPIELSAKFQLSPMALIVASMIDIEHPLLTCNRAEVSLTSCEIDCITAVTRGLPLAIPVMSTISVNTTCGQPVDNLWTKNKRVEFVHR